jgi:hypothetical protein
MRGQVCYPSVLSEQAEDRAPDLFPPRSQLGHAGEGGEEKALGGAAPLSQGPGGKDAKEGGEMDFELGPEAGAQDQD